MSLEQTFVFSQYEQSQDPQNKRRAGVFPPLDLMLKNQGVCVAYSCHYLKGRLSGQRQGSLEGYLRNLPYNTMMLENDQRAIIKGVPVNNLNTLERPANTVGLTGDFIYGDSQLMRMGERLTGLRPGEGLLFAFGALDPLSHKPAGSHACAAYHSRGKLGLGITGTHLYLFDPNKGEYRSTADELTRFLMGQYGNGSLHQLLRNVRLR